jgi:hypothetical protein
MEMRAKKSSRSSTSNTSGSTTTTAVERKEIERRRRQQMKSLCAKLASLIPKEHYSSKVMCIRITITAVWYQRSS